jgi:rubrerythrin
VTASHTTTVDSTHRNQNSPDRHLQPGLNDLATLRPDIARQWDPAPGVNPTTPQHVTATSRQQMTWICPKCSGRWVARVDHRVAGFGCPVCAGKKVLQGYSALATLRPDLAAEWDPTPGSNSKRPQDITAGSAYKAAWVCRTCGGRWTAVVVSRSASGGCPWCKHRRPTPGVNDLASQRPDLAAEWDTTPGANTRTPDQVTVGSAYRPSWKCTKCGHAWKTRVTERTRRNPTGCPRCAARRK